ncbi:MAG: RNA polymerase sigma factor [Actinomycetota bacterium]
MFFERIFQATYRATLAYAQRRTREVQDAQDVVAETYLVAWRRIDELRKVREPQAWLYGVAYRVLANQRRGMRRRQELADKAAGDPPEQGTDDPLRSVVSKNELEQVEEAMGVLSSRDQEVLRLAAWEGLTHREIAVALGIRRPLVRSVLHRARQRLNAALEETRSRHSAVSGHNVDVRDREEDAGLEGEADG